MAGAAGLSVDGADSGRIWPAAVLGVVCEPVLARDAFVPSVPFWEEAGAWLDGEGDSWPTATKAANTTGRTNRISTPEVELGTRVAYPR